MSRAAGDSLPVRRRVYLLSLLLPLMVYDLALKLNVLYASQSPSFGDAMGALRSDILFYFGYSLMWLGLFTLLGRRTLWRRTLMVILHLTAMILFVFTTAYYGYFTHTGSILTYDSLLVYLHEFSEIKAIIGAELHWYLEVFFVAAILYLIYGPLLICDLSTSLFNRVRSFSEAAR